MLDAVYVDVKKTKSIIAIKPQPPFIPIFQIAATKGGANIHIINEPIRTQSGSPAVFMVETGKSRTRSETLMAFANATTKYENTGAPSDVEGRVFLVPRARFGN